MIINFNIYNNLGAPHLQNVIKPFFDYTGFLRNQNQKPKLKRL